MDLASVGGLLGLISIVIHIIEKVYIAVNHKRMRSKCCGVQTEVSLDIGTITPPLEKTLLKSTDASLNIPTVTLRK